MTARIEDPEAAHILGNLIRLRAQLAEHPEQHDQSMWFHLTYREPFATDGTLAVVSEGYLTWGCATAACAAGWACLLAGDQPTSDSSVRTWDDHGMRADSRARRLLGLDEEDALTMFHEDNTLDDVLYLLDEHIRWRSE
jgi:hypothetical protein